MARVQCDMRALLVSPAPPVSLPEWAARFERLPAPVKRRQAAGLLKAEAKDAGPGYLGARAGS